MGKSCCAKSGSETSIVGSSLPRTNSSSRQQLENEAAAAAAAADEAAPCCCCCCCCGPGGCSKRAATLTFGVIGLLLAAGIIVPPVYIYTSMPEQDYTILFPVLKYGKAYLHHIVQQHEEGENSAAILTTNFTAPSGGGGNGGITPGQTYKLAIFQLLSDCERVTPCLAFASFCMGCVNVPLDLLLIAGACFRKAWPLTPWLVITLVEHLVVGVPLIVFTGLISLYLAAQLQLYVEGAFLMGFILTVFMLSMSSWFTVYSCYTLFGGGKRGRTASQTAVAGRGQYADFGGAGSGSCDTQLTQPLMTNQAQSNGGPHNHYYPGAPQYPTAPPTGPPPLQGGIYPNLA